MTWAQDREAISTKQQRIAELAREDPQRVFTSLAHHIDLAWLHEAYRRTRKDGAVGVDQQSAEQYAANLDANLRSLLDRAKSGQYRAPPVRRVHIPKGNDGATRPIGIPTFEDKVLQRAVAMVLESVYEQDFEPFSYGFRPHRSALQAGDAVRKAIMDHPVLRRAGGTIVELDIKKFFDTMGKRQLREFLMQRVRDGVLLRLIGKWLSAGVLEQGAVTYPEAGTPQGGVISPILANIYLHHVLDRWFVQEVQPRMRGTVELVRYADDAVIICESAQDAARILDVLPKRFGKYGLELHPDKTRLVHFSQPDQRSRRRQASSGKTQRKASESFDFLGFTFHWGKTRAGYHAVKRKTAADRLARALGRVDDWCKTHRHEPIAKQHKTLSQMLRGHYGYYGIAGNSRSIAQFAFQAQKSWQRWLARRGGKKHQDWASFNALLKRMPLPPPRLVHVLTGQPSAAKP